MITGLSHIGLVVKDLEKQTAFYRDVLGLRVLHERETVAPPSGDHTNIPGVLRKLVFLGDASGNELFELVYYVNTPSPEGQPLDRHQVNSIHFCFDIKNLRDAYKQLSEKGMKFLTEPKVIDRPNEGPVCLAYAQDPEGNWLEFKEELGNQLFQKDREVDFLQSTSSG